MKNMECYIFKYEITLGWANGSGFIVFLLCVDF